MSPRVSNTNGPGLPSRRRIIGLAGATLLVSASGGSIASGQEAQVVSFRAVSVDVRPLQARGGGGAAALIARLMPAKLTEVFADRLTPADRAAPVLVARVDTLSMASFADRPGAGSAFIGAMDQMEGAGLVLAGRQAMSATPLRVTLQPGYSGAFYLPDIDERRIDSICYQFAYWLRREMNL